MHVPRASDRLDDLAILLPPVTRALKEAARKRDMSTAQTRTPEANERCHLAADRARARCMNAIAVTAFSSGSASV